MRKIKMKKKSEGIFTRKPLEKLLNNRKSEVFQLFGFETHKRKWKK